MARKIVRTTQVFVNGVNVSNNAASVAMLHTPADAPMASVEFFVERWSVSEDGALEIHLKLDGLAPA